MRVFQIAILGALVGFVSSCSKPEGEGGKGSVSGNVYFERYDHNGNLINTEIAIEEKVYIVYGENTGFDDDLKKELLDLWLRLQKDLLTLSSNSTHVLAPDSGHFIQLEQPELVVEAIREMVSKKYGVIGSKKSGTQLKTELN